MGLSKPRRIYGRERLARLMSVKDTPKALQRATIETINTDGTVNLRTPDGIRTGVEVGDWYTPKTGDSVRVFRADPYSLFVLGTVRQSNNTTVEVASSMLFPYNVYKVPATAPPAPDIISGTSYFNAVNTRSYRSLDGWSRSEVYQGAYSSGYGYWRGCYFYGTAPQSLRGRTVLSGSIRISRSSAGGNASNVPQYIAPHAHAGQPSTAPYFTAAASVRGYVDWGQAIDLSLPASWLQALINGSARVRGFGHAVNGTGGVYSINRSRGSDALSGRLTIHWRT